MNKKGFTLIELLAVIIILAIIALIAVPTILNIIENSKKKALEDAAYGMIRVGEYYYLEHSNETYPKTFTGPNYEELEFKGEKVEGSLTISPDGKISINICDDGYCAIKGADESLVTVKKSSETTLYSVGDAVYYNPVSGTSCDNYSVSNIKAGCMKWYVISNNGETVDMILDHNTTPMDIWDGSGSNANGPVTANNQLVSDVSGWGSEAKSSARLISADEIAGITGAASSLQWDSSKTFAKSVTDINTQVSKFYFDGSGNDYTGWQSPVANASNPSRYYWLYENTIGCVENGCKTDNTSIYGEVHGYWTLSPVVGLSSFAWSVSNGGSLTYNIIDSDVAVPGIRPVITISKSSL